MTVAEYISYWYYTYRFSRQAKNTTQGCLTNIKKHVIETDFGKMNLADVRTKDIQLFLNDLMLHGNKGNTRPGQYGGPLSPWTLVKIRQYLIAMFETAIREDLLTRNYAAETQPISLHQKEGVVFSPEQKIRFLKFAKDSKYYLIYLLLFVTGCRRSEILGLPWDNVSIRNRMIKITQVIVSLKGKPYLKYTTKTKKSTRTIPIPADIGDLLMERKMLQEQDAETHKFSNPYNLVFTNEDGSMINPSAVSRNFKAILDKADLPNELHVHSTRHTWATDLIQSKVPISDVQHMGGWSRPDVLLGIYSHSLRQSQINAVNSLYETMRTN